MGKIDGIDQFTRAYIECALWSSTAYGTPEEDVHDPMDDDGQRRGNFDASFDSLGYGIDNMAPELLARILRECAEFQTDHADLLDHVGIPAQNGHDFWLTRNGHGTGFWDRGYPVAIGKALSDAARAWGSECWYFDHVDGVIRGERG